MTSKRPSAARQEVAGFRKITPCNGFDCANPDNARQNNYAWSMAEMGDYIYVGTGRNITYSVFAGQLFGPIPPPPEITPENLDMNAEIWRHRKGSDGEWERVFKSTDELGITGFRYMVLYTTPSGETALYAGSARRQPGVLILKSTDGVNWVPLPPVGTGTSTRAMIPHEGRLYMASLPGGELTASAPLLYVTQDPEREGWTQIDLQGDPARNPQTSIASLQSFNGRLYAGTIRFGGFELWRTLGAAPATDDWKLVVDRGAGDALNEIPLTLCIPVKSTIDSDSNRPVVPVQADHSFRLNSTGLIG